ncbi:MAG TPA: flavodoxin domain-containing protein [Methanocella sp.]|nr:flavodoxin domain-containing protein [Methanocella sp.]
MKKLVVVYLSTSGNTKRMADAIVEGADSRGISAESVSFYDVDISNILNADAIAIGSSTFWYKMHDAMERFLDRLSKENFKGKVGAAFGSYGWSGEAPVQIAQKMREMGITVVDPVLRVQYDPDDKDIKECERLGKDIAKAIKAEKPPKDIDKDVKPPKSGKKGGKPPKNGKKGKK